MAVFNGRPLKIVWVDDGGDLACYAAACESLSEVVIVAQDDAASQVLVVRAPINMRFLFASRKQGLDIPVFGMETLDVCCRDALQGGGEVRVAAALPISLSGAKIKEFLYFLPICCCC